MPTQCIYTNFFFISLFLFFVEFLCNRYYYQNATSGETRWGDLVKTESMNNPMRKKKKTISTPKMSDWVEHYDDTHGRPFFHNEKTGETTWERPRTKGGAPLC